MSEPIYIHVTGRKIFKQCRRKYNYADILRLAPMDSKVDALIFGVGCHMVMSDLYTMRQVTSKAQLNIEESWDNFKRRPIIRDKNFDQETTNKALVILNRYAEFSKEWDKRWKILEVEKTIEYPIPDTNIILVGTLDLIVEDQEDGFKWIIDHKFLSRMPDIKMLELDDQMTGYVFLAQHAGYNVRGCIYNAIMKDVPVPPELTTRGKLSVNKTQATTYELYLEAINDNGFNVEDYREFLDALKSVGENRYFWRHKIYRNRYEVANFGKTLYHEALDMRDGYPYFAPGMHCQWCKYQFLCKTETEGGDFETTKNTLYRVKEDYER